MNTVLRYELPKGFLASRKLAIPHRQHIEQAFNNSEIMQIHIDLSGVESISESYADEIFGVLVEEFGCEDVLNKIKIKNAKDYILENIAIVIDRRANTVCH
ncbi:STAS-like domain-containing protein [Acinetobacter thermotolerans]|uniref:STAS-like domain-containing protein n=1 Tax=Acinetobacter thermotolerans TaxID=3151487 RepID=UPI00325B798E